MKASTIAAELRREAAQERRDESREHFRECRREDRQLIEAELAAERKEDRASLTVDRHDRLRSALVQSERLAALALTSIHGMTAEQVAAAVASRAIAALRAKPNRGEVEQ